ncbi:DUF2092 domain-containing protein [Streptomyces sp. MRC013]|uniref:LolA family protein n=1 Tax=Streptomyces sp. MRC013 TaxID=2898276 RepID=UPI002026636D|nr:DUF2092 domain-containing protein [Streptomyces sp. MRC013]URM90122.1 DUF2092 domain-containing protein [Streptomyces sp. MRC013]
MAPNDSDAQTPRPLRRTVARYAVPAAVAGVAAATIGLVPALAASGDPDLPEITAQELVERIAAADAQRLSGTVKVTTDLGLPSIAGLGDLTGEDPAAAKSADEQLMRLASGTHTLRVAADGPDRQRLTVLDGDGEYTLVRDGDEAWAYDSRSGEVHHEKGLDAGGADGREAARPPVTPKELAARMLAAVDGTTSVTVGGTARVAGRDAYQLVVKPEQSGSTIGSVKVAVDAEKGVPLKFTLTPSGGGAAAVDVGFTEVDFGKPDASAFRFTPPEGAEVVEGNGPAAGAREKDGGALRKGLEGLEPGKGGSGPNVIGEGWTTVVELAGPGGAPAGAPEAGAGSGALPEGAAEFLDGLGTRVGGEFGSGMVFKTRLVNALMTDDGRVYVGAVTQQALVAAANDAAK